MQSAPLYYVCVGGGGGGLIVFRRIGVCKSPGRSCDGTVRGLAGWGALRRVKVLVTHAKGQEGGYWVMASLVPALARSPPPPPLASPHAGKTQSAWSRWVF